MLDQYDDSKRLENRMGDCLPSDTPFMSVIVPVYNVERYLEDCLGSMLAQTFIDWECLCTDDGCLDDSGDILDAYVRRDSRFHVVHQPNAGVSVARNRQLIKARGNWIGFLDGDDFVHPLWITGLFGLWKTNPSIDLIQTDFRYVPEKCLYTEIVKNALGNASNVIQECRMGPRIAVEMAQGGNFCVFVTHRSLIRGVRFNPLLRVGEDWVYLIKVCFAAQVAVKVDFVSYFYRKRRGSALSQGRQYSDALTFLPQLSHCFAIHRAELRYDNLMREARRHFSIAVELEYLGWFLETESSHGRWAGAHRGLLWRLWFEGFFRLSAMNRAWRLPTVLLMFGAPGKVFRVWAVMLRILVGIKHRLSWRVK